MPSIDSRIAKLEQNVRHDDDHRTKDERDAQYAAYVSQLLPIAVLCNSPEELEAHIKSKHPPTRDRVVSLDVKQREDAVRASFARMVWEEARAV